MSETMRRELAIQLANGVAFDDAYAFILDVMEKEKTRGGNPSTTHPNSCIHRRRVVQLPAGTFPNQHRRTTT